jgi:hypothetical protein
MKCCMLSGLVFVLILGVAFGVVFGVVPLDEIKKFLGINDGESNGNGNTGNNPAPTNSPTAAAFSFMQCPQKGDCCNGLESNCDLKPNEILWPTVHNAMHDDLLGNNQAPLEEAIEAGYRGLLLDVCLCEDEDTKITELVFCHSFCAVGTRKFDEVFPNINKFLNNNPSESIMINFEVSVGNPTAKQIWDAMSQYQGIKEKKYIHNSNTFPTMKQLQANNKQLLLFKHNGFDCSDTSSAQCTNRILEFHKYALETKYEFPSPEDIDNYSLSCAGDRGVNGRKDFFHINHFVTTFIGASMNAAEIINERQSLLDRITQCEKITKVAASLVSIDFWQKVIY